MFQGNASTICCASHSAVGCRATANQRKLASTVTHDEKGKQALECQGRNHAEIDRRNGARMVAEKCSPSL